MVRIEHRKFIKKSGIMEKTTLFISDTYSKYIDDITLELSFSIIYRENSNKRKRYRDSIEYVYSIVFFDKYKTKISKDFFCLSSYFDLNFVEMSVLNNLKKLNNSESIFQNIIYEKTGINECKKPSDFIPLHKIKQIIKHYKGL